MRQLKHTPTPFKAEPSLRGTWHVIYDNNDKSICQISTPDHEKLAHKMAAAPEMLDALELSLKYLCKLEADSVQTALPVSAAIRRVEQAITKAKGGAL